MNQDITNVLSGAKGAVTVAAGTVGIGIAERLDMINGVLGLVSLAIGIVVGVFVLIKTRFEIKVMRRKENDRRAKDRIK